jgi:hypothetical protein
MASRRNAICVGCARPSQFRGMLRNGSAPVEVNGGKAGEICRMELLKPGVVGSISRSPTTLHHPHLTLRGHPRQPQSMRVPYLKNPYETGRLLRVWTCTPSRFLRSEFRSRPPHVTCASLTLGCTDATLAAISRVNCRSRHLLGFSSGEDLQEEVYRRFVHGEIDQRGKKLVPPWGESRSASKVGRSFRFEGQMGFAPWEIEPAVGAPRLANPPFPNQPLMNCASYQRMCILRTSRSAQ